MQAREFSVAALIALTGAVAACAAPEDGRTGSEAQRIQGGMAADAYPEAVLLDVTQGGAPDAGCSGALIAPRVVLTSGRCAYQLDGWQVRAPFADDQSAGGVRSAVYDYDRTADAPTSDEHDVGLVFLDRPIALDTYPDLATEPLQDGDEVVGVGRVLDGQGSSATMYVSQPLATTDAASDGFGFDYAVGGAIEHGDSGGPDFLADTHTIVAVNAGSVDGTALLARVDLLNQWIQEQIAEDTNGGGDPGWPHGPGWPGGPGDGHGGHGEPGDGHGGHGEPGDGHGGHGEPGDGHGGGPGDGHGGGPGDGHGGPGGGHHP
jgi:Trypsin